MALEQAFPQQNPGITFDYTYFYRILEDFVSEGVAASGDLAVSERAGSPNLSVDVAAGSAYVTYDAPYGGRRRIRNTAVSNSGVPGSPGADWIATFATPDGSNPRVDRVIALVRDANLDATGQRDFKFRTITGTPTSGATLVNLNGAAAVSSNAIHLANVLVTAGATTIANVHIDTTVRALAQLAAGALPAAPAIPTGAVLPFGGTVAPAGFLLAQGQAVSRTTYAALFAVLGTQFGAGDGSTTFNLMDLRSRFPIGVSGTYAMGAVGGTTTETITASQMPVHSHTVNSHSHGGATGGQSVSHSHFNGGGLNHTDGTLWVTFTASGGTPLFAGYQSGAASADHNHGIGAESPGTNNQGSGASHNNLPPYQALNYVVKT